MWSGFLFHIPAGLPFLLDPEVVGIEQVLRNVFSVSLLLALLYFPQSGLVYLLLLLLDVLFEFVLVLKLDHLLNILGNHVVLLLTLGLVEVDFLN